VAHEAIFRRWDRLGGWIAAERGFLAWRTGLEAARRAWQTAPKRLKNDALLLGLPRAQAQSWLVSRAQDLSDAEREFIEHSFKLKQAIRSKTIGIAAFGGIAILFLLFALSLAVYGDWSLASFATVLGIVPAGFAAGTYFNSRVVACLGPGFTIFSLAYNALRRGTFPDQSRAPILVIVIILMIGALFSIRATFLTAKLRAIPSITKRRKH
jgi:hypothetical protein